MGGHSRFVSCVCVTPPDSLHPHGLIMTGSHDHTILAYTLDSPEPLFKLEGHADTVCSLAAGKFGTLVSGSWDMTAKVWLNKKCVMTLEGHDAAVWSVAIMPEGGYMLSGSADKTVRLWKAGKCERTFKGHSDCVRGLAVLSPNDFLSCSNDATVKRWLTTGECVQTFYGHTNFVYGIATFPGTQDFVTTSEDRSLKIWKDGECKQTIHHPCVSVWCVCVLSNGDIVTGGSDGMVRVFTCSTERMADEGAQQAYEQQLSSSAIPAQIGDIKTEELPPATALLNPGKRDGQTMMVRKGDQIEAHTWNASEGRWVKIGDVVGGSGGTQATSGKKLFQGKEYDYVFDVELDVEGVPRSMKLPFNAGEDPWMAAHNFLERNDISQMYLDQVANFILDQTKGVTIGQAAPALSDPFTGGGRYIPGTAPSTSAAGGGGGYSDPFTGAGRYVPSYGAASASNATASGDPVNVTFVKGGGNKAGASNLFFPKTTYLLFDSAKTDAILGKLKEFNSKAPNPMEQTSVEEMARVLSGEQVTERQLQTLWSLLQWPNDIVFPALDTLRLSVRSKATSDHFCNRPQFLERLLTFLSCDQPPANQMLALRTMANLFSQPSGKQLMISRKDVVIPAVVKNSSGPFNKNIQIAATSVLLNYAVAFHGSKDIETKCQVLSGSGELSGKLSDPEAHFRLLVGIGTLLDQDPNCVEIAKSMEMQLYTTKCAAIFEPKKVSECAMLLAKTL